MRDVADINSSMTPRILQDIITGLVDRIPAVLSDRSILEYNKKGLLFEEPLNDIQLQPNSVDLTLGNTWSEIRSNRILPNGEECIDPKLPMRYENKTFGDDRDRAILIRPGEFLLMASNEILNIPNGIVSFVCGRSSIARLGIQTEQAGFIDSGFRGTITLEVHNQSDLPIILYAGMRVAQVYFLKAEKADRLYGEAKASKYNDQIDATGSRIHLDPEFKK